MKFDIDQILANLIDARKAVKGSLDELDRRIEETRQFKSSPQDQSKSPLTRLMRLWKRTVSSLRKLRSSGSTLTTGNWTASPTALP